MKTSGVLAFMLAYRLALPGYHYEFPRDYFNHPEYRTEWWYYTGNVHSSDGRRFGFELTFFRQAADRETTPGNVWDVRDAWLAHVALSDIDGGRFLHAERLNRAGPGIAGADETERRVWNGNWQVRWTPEGERLTAIANGVQFDLTATPRKPPAIHGISGVSQKAAGVGQASHYFSETRLDTRGAIVLDGRKFTVDGLAWMDHEFFTHQLAANQTGWDWFSLQLDDGSDLMLYRLRRKDGATDPYSSGTYVDAAGRTTHLKFAEITFAPGKLWSSIQTGAKYPIEWTIGAPALGLRLNLSTRLANQELTGANKLSPSYWEGAIEASGVRGNQPVHGVGYLEMTGYAGAISFR